MRVVDLVVLAFADGPYSRAYLGHLRAAGYRPRAVVVLKMARGGRHVGSGISRVRRYAASAIGKVRAILQPWRRARPAPEWYPRFLAEVQERFSVTIPLAGPVDFREYTERVLEVDIEDFDDPRLLSVLRDLNAKAILFTGGGRVTPGLLGEPGIKVIHVHPGIVPDVRGSDGLFWSCVVRGTPGYSMFYMDVGLDTGDIIYRREFPPPARALVNPRWLENETDAEWIWKGLLAAYDPHLRAQTLVEVIRSADAEGRRLEELPNEPQDPGEGRTYFFMHPDLRRHVIRRFF